MILSSMMNPGRLEELIARLRLEAHPEGGYYRETYRSPSTSEPGAGFDGARAWSTGIYFLLTADNFSSLHRIKQDEMWHFYDGAPLLVHMIAPDGMYTCVTIGRDLEAGQVLQHVVPAGYWFGATVSEGGVYSLVGCTVSPGFDFKDFELADREALTASFPDHAEIVRKLTRG